MNFIHYEHMDGKLTCGMVHLGLSYLIVRLFAMKMIEIHLSLIEGCQARKINLARTSCAIISHMRSFVRALDYLNPPM